MAQLTMTRRMLDTYNVETLKKGAEVVCKNAQIKEKIREYLEINDSILNNDIESIKQKYGPNVS